MCWRIDDSQKQKPRFKIKPDDARQWLPKIRTSIFILFYDRIEERARLCECTMRRACLFPMHVRHTSVVCFQQLQLRQKVLPGPNKAHKHACLQQPGGVQMPAPPLPPTKGFETGLLAPY